MKRVFVVTFEVRAYDKDAAIKEAERNKDQLFPLGSTNIQHGYIAIETKAETHEEAIINVSDALRLMVMRREGWG